MRYFLDNKFAPTTFRIGLLDAPFQRVLDAYLPWVDSTLKQYGIDYEVVESEQPLPEHLGSLFPVTAIPTREMWMTTKSRWSATFDNGAHGGDPTSRVGHLCEVLQCSGVTVTCIPHIESRGNTDLYGGVQFQMYAPHRTGFLNFGRHVSAVVADEDRWRFDVSGPLQPFEETAQYSAPRIRDRFTPEMLERYCAALGIDLFNPDFYGPRAIMVIEKKQLPPDHPCWTREEARKNLGLD